MTSTNCAAITLSIKLSIYDRSIRHTDRSQFWVEYPFSCSTSSLRFAELLARLYTSWRAPLSPRNDRLSSPHDILAVLDGKGAAEVLVNEIQEVHRLQGVNISDKRREVISRQMPRWVKVDDVSDTEFLTEEVVHKFKFREGNARARKR